MRRDRHGLLVPGLLLTLLACLGVVMLFAVAMPVLSDHLPSVPMFGLGGGKNRIDVADGQPGSPSARARRTPSPSPSLSPRPSPSRTSPSPRASASSSRPATRPSRTPSSAPATRPSGGTTSPGTTVPSKTSPTPVSCAPGSITLAPVADAYIDQAAPSQNFGANGTMAVASRNRSRNKRALVRFALPAVPANCRLKSATLVLVAKENTGRQVLVARAASSWSESGVSWANGPGPAGGTSSATVSASTSFAVTGHVGAMLAGGNFGFLVYDAAESSAANVPQAVFGTREGSGAARLTISWS